MSMCRWCSQERDAPAKGPHVCDPELVTATERVKVIAWLQSEDARRYTEVGPLIANAIREGRHVSG